MLAGAGSKWTLRQRYDNVDKNPCGVMDDGLHQLENPLSKFKSEVGTVLLRTVEVPSTSTPISEVSAFSLSLADMLSQL